MSNNKLFSLVQASSTRINVIDVTNGLIVHQIIPPGMSNDRIVNFSADNRAEYVSVSMSNGKSYIFKKSGSNTWVIDRQYG